MAICALARPNPVTRAETAPAPGVSSSPFKSPRPSEPPEKIKTQPTGPLSLPPSMPSYAGKKLTNVRSFRHVFTAWFSAHDSTEAPPCTIQPSGASHVHRDEAGAPAIYTLDDGDTISVFIFRLSNTKFKDQQRTLFMAASHAKLGAFIIGHLRDNRSTSDRRAFRIWKGAGSKKIRAVGQKQTKQSGNLGI